MVFERTIGSSVLPCKQSPLANLVDVGGRCFRSAVGVATTNYGAFLLYIFEFGNMSIVEFVEESGLIPGDASDQKFVSTVTLSEGGECL
jgi:hypothetical protein